MASHQNEYDCVFRVVFCFEFLRECSEFGNLLLPLLPNVDNVFGLSIFDVFFYVY